MKLIITFVRDYPLQSAITLIALLTAGMVEGFGISALLPLLNIVMGTQAGVGAVAGSGTSEIAYDPHHHPRRHPLLKAL